MDRIEPLTAEAFAAFTGIANRLALVDFWAPWCGPCRGQLLVLDQVSAELQPIAVIGKVNVDDEPALARAFGVSGIPTILAFHAGELLGRCVGLQSCDAMHNWIDALLAVRPITPGLAGERRGQQIP